MSPSPAFEGYKKGFNVNAFLLSFSPSVVGASGEGEGDGRGSSESSVKLIAAEQCCRRAHPGPAVPLIRLLSQPRLLRDSPSPSPSLSSSPSPGTPRHGSANSQASSLSRGERINHRHAPALMGSPGSRQGAGGRASRSVSHYCHLWVSISLNKVELSVGESKFFTCTVIGEPVSLTWFNPQGEPVVSTQRVVLHTEGPRSRLTIYNAIVEDAGIYRCQAKDAKGHSQEATVVLEIYQKLTFRSVQTPQEFRQGEDAEVVCDVISSPVPAVSWFYKNKEILSEPNNRFQVLPNNNLQILRVGKSDEGLYRCEARVEARGEIDFRDIAVVVNGKCCLATYTLTNTTSSPLTPSPTPPFLHTC
ncbi:hypothetical protein ACEWY4_001960 [Coilia grayii]|uniref:Ig-like domain-containing protein n=1 Tax=Coilia grayii TaxID=363190 RepID=A0ABD1KUG3_9TELE